MWPSDAVRTISDGRWVYLRNYHTHRVHGQSLDYQFRTPTTRVWFDLHRAGALGGPAEMGPERLGDVLLVAFVALLMGHQMHHQRPALVGQRLPRPAPQRSSSP